MPRTCRNAHVKSTRFQPRPIPDGVDWSDVHSTRVEARPSCRCACWGCVCRWRLAFCTYVPGPLASTCAFAPVARLGSAVTHRSPDEFLTRTPCRERRYCLSWTEPGIPCQGGRRHDYMRNPRATLAPTTQSLGRNAPRRGWHALDVQHVGMSTGGGTRQLCVFQKLSLIHI